MSGRVHCHGAGHCTAVGTRRLRDGTQRLRDGTRRLRDGTRRQVRDRTRRLRYVCSISRAASRHQRGGFLVLSISFGTSAHADRKIIIDLHNWFIGNTGSFRATAESAPRLQPTCARTTRSCIRRGKHGRAARRAACGGRVHRGAGW